MLLTKYCILFATEWRFSYSDWSG